MKIRIIKASLPSYWYLDKIGKEYEVEYPRFYNNFKVINEDLYLLKDDCEIIEEPKQVIDINGIQTEPFTHEEKKVIAVEKDIFKLEIWNLLLEKFKLANDLQRIAILEIFEDTGYPQSDMVKLY